MTESRIAFRLGLLSTAVALLTPPATYAQAICSAPHSSPSLTQSGSIKTLPQGAGWLQVSLFRQQADESFNFSGIISGQRFKYLSGLDINGYNI